MHRSEFPTNSKPLSLDIAATRSLWPYIWPQGDWETRGRFLIAFTSLILAKIATLYVPLFFKDAVNMLSPQMGEAVVVPIFLILAYGMARLLSTVFSDLRDGVFATVTQSAVRHVGLKVFHHLHALGLRFHLDRQTGGLSRAIERGTKGIENLLQFLTFNIVPTIIEIIFVCALLWYLYGWGYALITLVSLMAYVAFTLTLTEWRIGFVRTMNEMDGIANTKAIDSLLNYETVKYFNNEAHEASRYDIALESYRKAAIRSRVTLAFLNIGQSIIITVGLIAILIFAGKEVQSQLMTVGDFVALNVFIIQLYVPLFMLGFAYREVKISLVNMENMFDLLNIPQEVKDKEAAPDIHFKKGDIEFKKVQFHYNKNRTILNDVSFHVPANHTVAIVGASGAGKSTISRLLFRFYDVTGGSITIDDQDIRDVTQESVRKLIGIVPQDTVLFNDTIEYNIRYGNPGASTKDVIHAAKSAQIHDFIESLPDGYQTQVGERGLKLSGGEKQRVAIARTLLKKPKIFLFDEATSALDSKTEKQIQESLNKLSENHTTLIIAHRLSTIVHADNILVFDKGTIAEQGTHKDLLKKEGLYATMWQRQQSEKGV